MRESRKRQGTATEGTNNATTRTNEEKRSQGLEGDDSGMDEMSVVSETKK